MRKLLFLINLLLLSGIAWSQQYDVYIEYTYRAFNYPIEGQIWNRTGTGNVYVRDGAGNIVASLNETFETSNRGSFEDSNVLGGVTNSNDLSFSSTLRIDTTPQSFTASDSDVLSGVGSVGFSMVTTPGWYLDGLISKREKLLITVPSKVLCYEGKALLQATLGHPSEAYNWEFLNPVTSTWESLGARFSNKNISLVDILPNDFADYIGIPIGFRVRNTLNNYIVNASYTWLDCSIELRDTDPIQTTNAKCNGNTNGAVTLNFKDNVEPDYEMRYYIYEGEPSSFPSGEEKNPDPSQFPQAVDNVRFSDGPSPNQVGPLESNTDGTFRGKSKESLGEGTYYVLYQEVRYDYPDIGDVDVKSGELIPDSFDIYEPSIINASATITQPACNSTEAQIDFFASGGNNLDASGTYSYQYQLNGDDNWRDANTNPQPVIATTNEQTVEIRAIYTTATNEGCESSAKILTDKIEAIVPPLEFSNLNPGITSSVTTSDAVISINYDGGTPNYSFELLKLNTVNSGFEPVLSPTMFDSPLNKRAEFQNLGVGTYRITIVDSNTCSLTSDDISVTTTPPPVLGMPEITPISCTDPTSGAITVDVSGGVSPYNYEWTINSNASPAQTTSDSSISLTNLSEPGEYILKVASNGFTDFNDPLGYVTNTINIAAPVQVNIDNTTITNISCNGSQDGSILVAASGATNYEYKLDAFDNWEDLNDNTIPITAGGVYDLYLRNKDNSCEATPLIDALLVEEPEEFIVSEVLSGHFDVSTNEGNNGAIEIIVSGGTPGTAPDEYTFEWTGILDNGSSFTASTQNIQNLFAGTYQVMVIDSQGCTTSLLQPIEITQPGPLAINDVQIQNAISCAAANDGVIVANVTGTSPITYEWTRDGAPYRTLIDENTISDLPPGAYQLFLNDGSSPDPLESAVFTLIAPTVITADVSSTDSCSGVDAGSISISNVTGGTPGTVQDYTYSIDNGTTFQNSPLFENLEAGNYIVRVRDGNDCDFIQTDVLVTQFPAITWDAINTEIIGITAAGRNDGAISPVFLGGTPPFNYIWIGPGIKGTTTKDVNGLVEGNYSITVTDANECDFIQAFEITETGELTAVSDQSVFLECNGDDFAEITATVQGGVQPYTLEWFETINGNDNLLPEDTEIIGNLSSGTYFLRVTDTNAVTIDSAPVEIIEPDLLEAILEDTIDVLCSGEATGAISIVVSGGTPPYSYAWNNGETTQNLTGIEAGEYTLEVIDANGCFDEITTTVNAAPDALRIADATISNVSEYLSNDGTISLDVIGGAVPYTINWVRLSDNSTAGNQETLLELSAGFYRVFISDANGCSVTETYEITQPDIVEETIVPPSCNGETNGSISLLVNKGNGTFTYEWSTGATTNTINGLAAGNYTVRITGFSNGPITRTYTIENPEPLSVDLGENRTLCIDQELVLDATVENESAIYTWSSDNGFSSNDPNVTLTETGNYTVTVTTPTGCSAEGSIFVDISTEEINAEFAISSQVFVNETFVAVDISYPLPDSLEWILPDEAIVLKKNSDEVELRFDTAGEYNIEIITARGNCIAQKTKKIIVVAPDGAVTKADTGNGKKLIEDFIVYPNPSNGKFTAEVNLTERGNVSVKVFSFANNAMMASTTDRGELSYNIPFDLSGLPAGVYAILLETPYGNTLRKVILK